MEEEEIDFGPSLPKYPRTEIAEIDLTNYLLVFYYFLICFFKTKQKKIFLVKMTLLFFISVMKTKKIWKKKKSFVSNPVVPKLTATTVKFTR